MVYALGGSDVGSNVADVPVNLTVRPFNWVRHTVPTEADVYAVAVANGGFLIQNSVAVGVFESPHIGCNGHKSVFGPNEQAPGHVGHFLKKIVQNPHRHVGKTVVVGVLQPPNFILFNRQIAPVVATVFIEVFEPVVFFAFCGVKRRSQKCTTVFNRLKANRLSHPVAVAPNVKFGIVAPVGAGNVHAALVVDGHSDGVGGERIRSPQRYLETVGQFNGSFITDFFSFCQTLSRVFAQG